MPDSVSVPLPVLTSAPPVPPANPPSRITPLTVVDKLLPPTVIVFDPRKKVPEPSREPGVVPIDVSPEKSTAPVFTISRAVPPDELSLKKTVPLELCVIVALPAVLAPLNIILAEPLFVMLALPAVLLFWKKIPLLFVIVALPAVLVLKNWI